LFRLIIIILFSTIGLNAQSFGFGCFGLVGGFGGYSYQTFKATGFNEFLSDFNESARDSLNSDLKPFRRAAGFRFGINFFRADFEGFILTTKGFYQSLSEKHDATFRTGTGGEGNLSYELQFKSWGLGVDLGTSITRNFSWKVMDVVILFNKGGLIETFNYPGTPSEVNNYENRESSIGYSVGTGFILNIIDRYVTLEGTAGYTFLPFRSLSTNEGEIFSGRNIEPVENFIEKFGFNAVIQINIGFPF
jgi:hypothetical protein